MTNSETGNTQSSQGTATSQDTAQDLVAKIETGARVPEGFPKRLILTVAFLWSAFQVWIASPLPFILGFGIFNSTQARSIHLAFAIFLAFLSFPGMISSARGYPIFSSLFGIGGLVTLVYAVMAFLGDDGGRALIFAATGLTALLVCLASFRPAPLSRIPLLDWLLALLAVASVLYLFVFYEQLTQRPGAPILSDLVVSGIGMILLLEASRRSLGPALTSIAAVFLVYAFAGPYMPNMIAHGGASFSRMASQQWLTQEGVFGIALGVSTSFVFLFVLFGSMLDKAGAGNYFIQVAFAFLGHMRGGPAKAAVVSSGMTGIISGSSIANTVTTGTFTIPLMKRVGYKAEQAGAIEVSSSVNGQIMPPVMGAAAFLMIEYVGIPYIQIIKHAFLPAVITYVALLYIVHLEALKMGLQGLPKRNPTTLMGTLVRVGITVTSLIILSGLVYYGIGWIKVVAGEASLIVILLLVLAAYLALLWQASRVPELHLDDPNAPILQLPEAGPTVKSGLYFLLPVVILIWCLMIERLSPGLSAFYAVAFMIFILLTQRPILAVFRQAGHVGRAAWAGVEDLASGFVAGARNMVGIAVATATAGIIVGVVAQTGLSQVLAGVVETVSGGNLMIMLILTAVLCLILGMGLPTTANYIVVATIMAPVIVELGPQNGLVVPLIAVHLFVFYFGIMADVTPPVGLASFAAAAISRGDPIKTGFQAFYYSLRTVILPFIFIFNTQLLLIGVDSIPHVILVAVTAQLAMLIFAAATQGFFVTKSRIWESAALLLAALMIFRPGLFLDQFTEAYLPQPPAQLMEIVEDSPSNRYLRMEVEGLNDMGDEVTKTVMLNLGAPMETPEERLSTNTGLHVSTAGDQVRIDRVTQGSEASDFNIGFGYTVTSVQLPNPDRPPGEIMLIPALLLAGGVWFLQRRRRPRESGQTARAQA
ncbi:TRAP transporter permease [Fodinicurvata fenggangensis]|uniref:TRAP transporter permease n=1 Tax=Fodinicurvata fenggangensis TaxID=1121830 RepID=UPI00047D4ECA|nr:TRAP transporter fused permease subunit [Fodinicurvata fenggangensis]